MYWVPSVPATLMSGDAFKIGRVEDGNSETPGAVTGSIRELVRAFKFWGGKEALSVTRKGKRFEQRQVESGVQNFHQLSLGRLLSSELSFKCKHWVPWLGGIVCTQMPIEYSTAAAVAPWQDHSARARVAVSVLTFPERMQDGWALSQTGEQVDSSFQLLDWSQDFQDPTTTLPGVPKHVSGRWRLETSSHCLVSIWIRLLSWGRFQWKTTATTLVVGTRDVWLWVTWRDFSKHSQDLPKWQVTLASLVGCFWDIPCDIVQLQHWRALSGVPRGVVWKTALLDQ